MSLPGDDRTTRRKQLEDAIREIDAILKTDIPDTERGFMRRDRADLLLQLELLDDLDRSGK